MVVLATWLPHLTESTAAGVERMTLFPWVFGFFFVSLGTAMTLPLANAVDFAGFWVRPITAVSEHAYTLYLLHEFGRDIILRFFNDLPFGVVFALSFGLSFVLAAALRLAVELPGLKVRDWALNRQAMSVPAPF